MIGERGGWREKWGEVIGERGGIEGEVGRGDRGEGRGEKGDTVQTYH